MNKYLTYLEFRTGYYRNLTVCKNLLESLNNCQQRDSEYIKHKTYYLAGYIIEFCYKFALFSHLKLKKTENIYSFGNEGFKKKWKEHSFGKLQNICSEEKLLFSQDIPFFGSPIADKDVKKLIENWDVQIRYSLNLTNSKIELEKDTLRKLINELQIIADKITSKYS